MSSLLKAWSEEETLISVTALAKASRISNQRQITEEIWILVLKKQTINFWAKMKNRILKYRSNLSSESKNIGVFSPKHTALLEQLQ